VPLEEDQEVLGPVTDVDPMTGLRITPTVIGDPDYDPTTDPRGEKRDSADKGNDKAKE
jgi:hypothetical protein